MAKVLLVNPHEDIRDRNKKVLSFTPLSLVYLGTAIEDKHEVKIYDRNLYNNDERYVNFLKNYNPDIVGFTSVVSTMLYDLMHLGKLTKKTLPKAIIIIGGVQATVDPDTILNEPYVNYVMRGEGEEALLEFCDTFDKNPKKLGKLNNINKNPLRQLVDMNKLKLPNYDLLELDKYEKFYVNLSRGCIGNCKFCYNVQMWGRKGNPCVRAYSTEKAIELFKTVVEKHKKKVFWIVDDNFLFFKSRCIEICKFLEKYKIHFWAPSRADCINEEILTALKRAGCHTIAIGIESGSQRILDLLNKRVSVQQNINAIKLCKKYGMTVDALMMVGLPTETLEELRETVDFIKTYKPEIASIHMYNPLPSELHDYCIEKGLLKKPESLEDWANFGGLFKSSNNVSNIPDEKLKEAVKELENYRFFRKNLTRLWLWLKYGEIRYIIRTTTRVLKRRFLNE